jgi:hypothetical protein
LNGLNIPIKNADLGQVLLESSGDISSAWAIQTHMFWNTLFPRILFGQKFIYFPRVRYNGFSKNVTRMYFGRTHLGVPMFTQHCTDFFIAAVRGAVKPDIFAVNMCTLMKGIWIFYSQKATETAGYFCRMN